MPSTDETDARIAQVHAWNKQMHDERIADYNAQLEVEKDPVEREWLRKRLEEVRAIGNGAYED